ncbi:MAG: LacI family DNA-binding transcriptional regulator [Sphaerochaetaceae bacterium]
MKPRNVTIKFLAEKAGVSFSTVAKALHDDPVININTRKKIQALAKEYNYTPNILAKGLRNRRTMAIGVILNDLQSPFYSEIYKAIGEVLNKKGYTMFLADSNYDANRERKNILTMKSQGVEGIIISSVSEDSANIDLLINEGVKTVFIDNLPTKCEASCVYVDHEAAAYLAVSHLIENGHSKILLLNGPEGLPSSHRYLQGYQKTLKMNGIPFQKELVKYNPIEIEATSEQMERILNGEDEVKADDFTAIVTLSDVIAIGIYEAACSGRFSIPDTYSVVGYDNILATKYLNPPLTTVNQPKEGTGLHATAILLDSIEQKSHDKVQVILNPELLVRSSVKKIES